MTLTVSAVTKHIKALIEGDESLSNVIVEGEISNFTFHRASGHLYFSLKDEGAVISAIMFRGNASSLGFKPENGMKVLAKGRISLYEKSGQYQIYITAMKQAGLGDLHIEFEKMKRRLYEEGLFDSAKKRKIPLYPKTIGVITSKSGAAVRDIMNIIGRRYPIGRVLLYPALVQGDGAVDSMVTALSYFEETKAADVIIIGRGGGSIEDLWAFNEEKLARKIYSMTVPVISAVGHETDTTICDYVADLRAPTPSAAAELAVPDLNETRLGLESLKIKLIQSLNGKTAHRRQRLDRAMNSRVFKKPEAVFDAKRMSLDRTLSALGLAARKKQFEAREKIKVLAERIDGRSPMKIMTAGYSVALNKAGKRISSVADISPEEEIRLTLTDGQAVCEVKEINND